MTIQPEQILGNQNEIDEQFGEGTMHLQQMDQDNPIFKMKMDVVNTLQDYGRQHGVKDPDVAAVLANILGMVRYFLVKAGMSHEEFENLLNLNMDLDYKVLEEQERLLAQIAAADEKPKKKSWRNLLGFKRR